jgi:2',3'-cyclic-nucleotide 2'-phosphodiesterase (5'-nucleotidase family)
MRGKQFQFSIIVLFLFFIIGTSLSIGKEVSFTLIYTSNNLGEVEPCSTCPEAGENGGLPRRSHFVNNVRKEVKDLLVLDGGDALVIDYFSRKSEREKARKRAEVVLRLYEKIGYEALNIGDTDIGLGVEYLKNLQKRVKIPFLSANLKDGKTGKPVFTPYLIKDMGGAKIGIIGLLTANVPSYLQKEMTNYLVEEPIKVAINMVNGPMSHCSYVFALAHLTPPEMMSLAQRVPDISIIIGGQNRSLVFPNKINQSIVAQTDAFGFHVGRMNIRFTSRSSEWVDVLPKTLLQKNIEEIKRKIEDPQYEKEAKNLKELRERLIDQQRKLPDAEGKNTYENFLTLMHPKMESDKQVESLIKSSRDQLKRPIPY